MKDSFPESELKEIVAAPPPVGGLGGGRKKLPGATQGPRNWVGKDGKGIIFFQKSFYKKLK